MINEVVSSDCVWSGGAGISPAAFEVLQVGKLRRRRRIYQPRFHHGYTVRGIGSRWAGIVSRGWAASAFLVAGASTHSGTVAAIRSQCVPGDGHHAVRGAHLHVWSAGGGEVAGENPQDHLQIWAHEWLLLAGRCGARDQLLCFLSHGARSNPHVQRKRGKKSTPLEHLSFFSCACSVQYYVTLQNNIFHTSKFRLLTFLFFPPASLAAVVVVVVVIKRWPLAKVQPTRSRQFSLHL